MPDGQKYDTEAMKDDEIEIPVQINGKTRAVIKISAETTKEEAIGAGKEAIADKLTGNIVKRNLRSEEDHKHCAKNRQCK